VGVAKYFSAIETRRLRGVDLPGRRAVADWDWDGARQRCLREARRVLRDHDDAEEAVQEALARGWKHRNSCRTPDEPLGWLVQITRNEAMRIAKRRAGDRAHEECEEVRELGCADLALEGVGTRLTTRSALRRLSHDDRRLVALRYILDMPQAEMAQALSVPEMTVGVKLHRMRKRLRAELAREKT
jgi:RNA polymerase sigma-70 factor (ECF subfamily)